MCGIAGVLAEAEFMADDLELLVRINAPLLYRGPDCEAS